MHYMSPHVHACCMEASPRYLIRSSLICYWCTVSAWRAHTVNIVAEIAHHHSHYKYTADLIAMVKLFSIRKHKEKSYFQKL